MSSRQLARKTVTDGMGIEAVLSRLAALSWVDGLALYGPKVAPPAEAASDYDVLVLVSERPLGLVQIFTQIGGRVADVLFMEVSSYDRALNGSRRFSTTAVEGMFMLKIRHAEIVKDQSHRLHRGREAARNASCFSTPT